MMMSPAKRDRIDRAALRLAFTQTCRELDRQEQLDSMLADGAAWEDVAFFAAYHRQRDTLNLRPWELAPCEIDLEDIATQELGDPFKGGAKAAALVAPHAVARHFAISSRSDAVISLAEARAAAER